MLFVYGFVVGLVVGAAAIWIWKNHLIHEMRKGVEAISKK